MAPIASHASSRKPVRDRVVRANSKEYHPPCESLRTSLGVEISWQVACPDRAPPNVASPPAAAEGHATPAVEGLGHANATRKSPFSRSRRLLL